MIKIDQAFNNAEQSGELSAPVVLGRDHYDVRGTDSPFRETSNIYDGSKFTADMAISSISSVAASGATLALNSGENLRIVW